MLGQTLISFGLYTRCVREVYEPVIPMRKLRLVGQGTCPGQLAPESSRDEMGAQLHH